MKKIISFLPNLSKMYLASIYKNITFQNKIFEAAQQISYLCFPYSLPENLIKNKENGNFSVFKFFINCSIWNNLI